MDDAVRHMINIEKEIGLRVNPETYDREREIDRMFLLDDAVRHRIERGRDQMFLI